MHSEADTFDVQANSKANSKELPLAVPCHCVLASQATATSATERSGACLTVVSTSAACDPPITPMPGLRTDTMPPQTCGSHVKHKTPSKARALGHMKRKRGSKARPHLQSEQREDSTGGARTVELKKKTEKLPTLLCFAGEGTTVNFCTQAPIEAVRNSRSSVRSRTVCGSLALNIPGLKPA